MRLSAEEKPGRMRLRPGQHPLCDLDLRRLRLLGDYNSEDRRRTRIGATQHVDEAVAVRAHDQRLLDVRASLILIGFGRKVRCVLVRSLE